MNDRTRELECVISDLKQQVRDTEKVRDALRAKITEMEQQEPVAWVVPPSSRPHWGEHAMQDAAWEARQCGGTAKAEPLYALPGAQSVPDVDALAQLIREIDGKHQLGAGALAERIVEWLAAAPEAKP